MTQSPSRFDLLENPSTMPERLLKPVLAIGNFDGLHRGHRAVTDAALRMGRRLGRPVVLLTFEPHPRVFFRPDVPLFRLTDKAAKARLAERIGLDGMIVLTFDKALATESADAFIMEILIGRLGLSGAVVGFDFQFGAKRAGTPQSLAEAGQRLGFEVEIIPEQKEGGEGISSTLIRAKLGEGNIDEANRLLGYEWFIVGEVIHGRKVGRTIGYPTANIRLADDCGLKHGIYAVRLTVDGRDLDSKDLDGKNRAAVASFGRRPTFDNGAPLLEVFVFDFDGDLYGKTVEVAFIGFIRGEEKFEDVAALIAQMDRDSLAARAILAGGAP